MKYQVVFPDVRANDQRLVADALREAAESGEQKGLVAMVLLSPIAKGENPRAYLQWELNQAEETSIINATRSGLSGAS